MKFKCTGCGLCCKSVEKALEAAKTGDKNDPIVQELLSFPYSTVDGVCEMLNENGECKVYDSRPDICDVNKTFKKHHKGTKSKKEYFRQNNIICNQMIKENNLSDEFLIKL